MFESMFNTAWNASAASTSISLVDAVLTIVVAFILGGITSITYMKTSSEKDGYSQNFAVTLIIIPAVIAIHFIEIYIPVQELLFIVMEG